MIAILPDELMAQAVSAAARHLSPSGPGAPARRDVEEAVRSALALLQPHIERQVVQRAEDLCDAVAAMWMLQPDDAHADWVHGFDTGCETCAGAVHGLLPPSP